MSVVAGITAAVSSFHPDLALFDMMAEAVLLVHFVRKSLDHAMEGVPLHAQVRALFASDVLVLHP